MGKVILANKIISESEKGVKMILNGETHNNVLISCSILAKSNGKVSINIYLRNPQETSWKGFNYADTKKPLQSDALPKFIIEFYLSAIVLFFKNPIFSTRFPEIMYSLN